MKARNYILEYYQAIKSGGVTVGEWVRRAYEYIINGLENRAFFYDQKKANRVINFVENFCHHHEGELAPGLIKLELWQKAFLSCVFGIVDETGARQFREILLIVGRKNGKTLLSACLSEYLALVSPSLEGDYGARVYMAAPKLEQANLCYNACYQMILQEPAFSAMCKKRRTDIYIPETNSTIKPLAFSAKKSDGLNVSACIADEIASWRGDAGIKFYEVIKSSFGARRQPLLLSISTAGYETGIYDELYARATRVLLGNSNETRFFPLMYIIDDISKWNDISELQKSMPNLGTSVSVNYLLEEVAIAEESLSRKVEFITKMCNVKQNSSTAWISTETLAKCCGDPVRLEDFRNCYCCAGIDLSRTTDLSAVVLTIEKGGKIYVYGRAYIPGAKIAEASERDGLPYELYIKRGWLYPSGENYIDYHDILNFMLELVKKYKIYPLIVGYDRYNAQYLTDELKKASFHLDDVFQGDNLYGVLLETEARMRDGGLIIGDNELFKAHLLDGVIKMNVSRGRGKLEKIAKYSHIDLAAALIDAMTVRQKHYGALGRQLKNEGK